MPSAATLAEIERRATAWKLLSHVAATNDDPRVQALADTIGLLLDGVPFGQASGLPRTWRTLLRDERIRSAAAGLSGAGREKARLLAPKFGLSVPRVRQILAG